MTNDLVFFLSCTKQLSWTLNSIFYSIAVSRTRFLTYSWKWMEFSQIRCNLKIKKIHKKLVENHLSWKWLDNAFFITKHRTPDRSQLKELRAFFIKKFRRSKHFLTFSFYDLRALSLFIPIHIYENWTNNSGAG